MKIKFPSNKRNEKLINYTHSLTYYTMRYKPNHTSLSSIPTNPFIFISISQRNKIHPRVSQKKSPIKTQNLDYPYPYSLMTQMPDEK